MKPDVIREIAEKEARRKADLLDALYEDKNADWHRDPDVRPTHINRDALDIYYALAKYLRILEQAGFVSVSKDELETTLKPLVAIADASDKAAAITAEHFKDEGFKAPPPDKDSHPVVTTLGICRRARAMLAALTQEGRG